MAHANPTGGTVVQGTATFNTSGSQFKVTTSDRAYLNWQSFNIGVGQTTTFVQPSASSVVWNQINDPNPSQILGTLNANGYVILQNSSGFYVGGQASINTHGLLMTTAPIPMADLSSGSPWQFNSLPPAASIINYGQINISGGGSAFLIAHNVANHGSITAPGGSIGLYAGKEVLVSTRPDGRGLSAAVTLPEGSVDNSGKLIADGGAIAMRAKVVNQGGVVQANSVREVNGVIELLASDSITLGADSSISAHGDDASKSSGGAVTIKSDNTFSDQATSAINISGGALGGNGGQLEISAAHIESIQSAIDARAGAGFRGGSFLLDPVDLALTSAFVSTLSPLLNSGLYQISLQADNNITLSTLWTLSDPGAAALLTLNAGNNIIFNNGSGLRAGNNWSVDLSAGPKNLAAKPTTARTAGIYLDGNSFIETLNGNIKLWAANEVIVNSGAIRTRQGGSIDVTAQFGDVNSGINGNGYVFNIVSRSPPLYTVSSSLGGISTAAGGDVTITAGRNVISFLPTQPDYNGGRSISGTGAGAFGSQPGNVTINAGGNVSGSYVLANGLGKIKAGGNIGNPGQQGGGLALNLIKGDWNVSAPNGSIYLQEVRNPNGVFNTIGGPTYSGFHYFDYDPFASVSLQAGNMVEIIGGGPRPTATPIPILLPPILSITAGRGGIVLDQNVILFPSPFQNLKVFTLNGGNLEGNNRELLMSSSARMQWTASSDFLASDRSPYGLGVGDPNPIEISVSGDVKNSVFYTTKAAHMKVGGDLINSSFLGQNLRAGDKTSIDVGGRIYNTPSLNFVDLPGEIVSANPNQADKWDSVFDLVVDPTSLTGLDVTKFATVSDLKAKLRADCLLFPNASSQYGLGGNPGFVYDASAANPRLGFNGNITGVQNIGKLVEALKNGVVTVLVVDAKGDLVVDPADRSRLLTKTYTFISPDVSAKLVGDLVVASSLVPKQPKGYQIGGPGQFNITAASVELGNSPGVISWGIGNGSIGQAFGLNYASLAAVTREGAAINLTVSGDVSMMTSRIACMFGGDVNVTSTGGGLDLGSQNLFISSDSSKIAYGIFAAGHSDVKVMAYNDVNINGSRIATYNGGNIFVESTHGNVNAGSGGNSFVSVPLVRPSGTVSAQIYGSGIVAISLAKEFQTQGTSDLPGNISVKTPRGDIVSSQAGILQLALSGNVAGGPTITLEAGTPASGGNLGYAGNINLGNSGLIGGSVTVKAEGNVAGLFISRQGSSISAAQSFSGTLLSGGNASVSAGGTVSGTVIGVGGAAVSGGAVTADVVGQNVSVNGGASASTLGTQATATSTSQSAANQANSDAKQQVASNDPGADDEQNKKGRGPKLTKSTGRVTVILPKT